ncbi:MAG: pentapeptide repeat-containing protein [Gaiellaceae bacterium]
MRLTNEWFNAVDAALLDAFTNLDDYLPLSRRSFNVPLAEITEDATVVVVATRVIQYAESCDAVVELIRAAKALRPGNQLLAALDDSRVAYAPSSSELVNAGRGGGQFKDQLKEALGNLDVPGMQLVAADELSRLLEGASTEEANTLYLAVLGNLKTNRPVEVVAELAPLVATCLRSRIGAGTRPDDLDLDLARTRLRRIDLSGLDLHEADLAFGDLSHAKLENSNLWRSRAYAVDVTVAGLSRSNLEEARWHKAVAREARFHNCRMISVFLKDADLEEAEFQQSRLQGAHFERANLTRARFEEANVADAVFTGATINEAAAGSLAKAKNWRQARFDPATKELIEAKAAE